MIDSNIPLAEFVQNRSDAAFGKLLTCYLDLVYSTALRLVGGDTHRAKDVTQTVFVDLARMAPTLPKGVMLGGWLHRHTCFVTSTLLRGERRRQIRERQATEMNALQNDSEADFSVFAPILDEVINQLSDMDRTAILLRFFEQRDFRAIGQALGSNEDAARMRVARALEKLEGFLKRRGIRTSAASLGIALSANVIQSAPAGLAMTLSTAAALGATTATAATQTTMNFFNAKIIATLVASALAAGTGTYLVHRHEANVLRRENESMLVQTQELTAERDSALAAARARSDEHEQSRKDKNELLRLRGEVGMLRKQTNELWKLSAENSLLQARLAERQPARAQAAQGQTGQATLSFITVGGQVRVPNRLAWRNGMSLKSVVEGARGFTDLADTTKIQITREDGTSTTLNYSASGGSASANTPIFQNDKIFIPRLEGNPPEQ